MKWSKSVNANHTEVSYFGNTLYQRLKEIHVPETPQASWWLQRLSEIHHALHHFHIAEDFVNKAPENVEVLH